MTEQSASTPAPAGTPASGRITGIGRLLVVVYAILALGATGRSVFQLATKFDEAPVAYSLSAYIVATVALVLSRRGAARLAWITIGFELAGVLVVGLWSVLDPALFAHPTVWSYFGIGYLFIPLVLPVLGLMWLAGQRKRERTAA
jgi:hypothetical protein